MKRDFDVTEKEMSTHSNGTVPAVEEQSVSAGLDGEHDANRWVRPAIKRLGAMPNILASGGGKVTMASDGDGRKPSPQT